MVKDLVCGMMVDHRSPGAVYDYRGKTYYFCHENCKKQFEQDPEKYIDKEKQDAPEPEQD